MNYAIFLCFLENFQKSPGGIISAARRHMGFILFWASLYEAPGGIGQDRQATRVCDTIWGFLCNLT